MTVTKKLFLAGRWEETGERIPVVNPYDGEVEAMVYAAGATTAVEAVAAAAQGFTAMRRCAAHVRARILHRTAELLLERREDLARTITKENGKPIQLARGEVERAAHTFAAAGEEATRMHGEVLPLDLRQGLEGRFGITRRVPVGPVLGIAPFNFPLNLVAHKVAPALAAGCSIVVKPASRTPLTALLLAELLEQAGLPPGGVSVLPCSRSVGDLLVQDDTFRALSFTGSSDVGFGLKARAGKKPVLLELGGNAAVIVHHDADVDHAVQRCVTGAFAYSGQVCISVQRIFLHEKIADAFTEKFVERTAGLAAGDPMDENTEIGPLIDEENAIRIETWIADARERGAKLLCGGTRDGAFMSPAVLTNVDRGANLDCREAFGPVVNLHRYREVGEAIDGVNASRYGLQAGLFTRDLGIALRAYEQIEVGALVLNDAPNFRLDTMPYGGTKDSGIGREGVRYAIEHFTELRLLAVAPPRDA